jgi:hypothetical protein
MIRRRIVTKVLGLMLVPAASLAVVAGQASGGPATQEEAGTRFETGGYSFADVEIVEHGDRYAISYVPGWSTENYPGKKSCNWEVFDSTGASLGHHEIQLIAAQARYTTPVEVDIEFKGTPSAARVECQDQRLDDPSGHFEISDARVESSYKGKHHYLVSFSHAWLTSSEGQPPPQLCDVEIYGRDGSLLDAEQYGLITNEGTSTGTFVYDAPEGSDEPTSASVVCSPI